jgi:predicted nucleotidyltransferase
MITQLFDKDIMAVLTVFSLSPGSRFRRKELKEKTRLNNVSLDNALTLLLNSGLIKKEKRLLSLNFDKENTRQVIALVSQEYKNLRELPLDVYFSVTGLVSFLDKLKGFEVYLFGSYAKLVFKEGSDIDVAIVSGRMDSKTKAKIGKATSKLESRYKTSIEVHYFTKKFHKSKKDPLVKDILKNGIRLI